MDHNELLNIVDDVLTGPMSDAAMRRALSTLYYAMFHFLAKSNADLLAGGGGWPQLLDDGLPFIGS